MIGIFRSRNLLAIIALIPLLLSCGKQQTALQMEQQKEYEEYFGKATFDYEKDKLPSSVKYTRKGWREHEYVISGLYLESSTFTADYDDTYFTRIPYCISANTNLSADTFTFVTRTRLAELPKITVDLARSGGRSLPTWLELVTRDSKAPVAATDLYHLSYVTPVNFSNANLHSFEIADTAQARLNVYSAVRDVTGAHIYQTYGMALSATGLQLTPIGRPSSKPASDLYNHSLPTESAVTYGAGKTGTVRLNLSTGYCKCHFSYAMRLFDDAGQWIWEDQDYLYGSCAPFALDLDHDGIDEIIVYRADHSKVVILVFTQRGPEIREDTMPQQRRV